MTFSEPTTNMSDVKAMMLMADDLGDVSQWVGQNETTPKRIHNCEWDNVHGDIVSF